VSSDKLRHCGSGGKASGAVQRRPRQPEAWIRLAPSPELLCHSRLCPRFEDCVILVQQGVVSGRIGKLKTEASQDEIPLDPVFAQLLLTWRGERSSGLVFPSHVTGRSYHAGILQQKILGPKGAEIGIPKLGWHTFRHTYRSLLDEAGAPIGVQQKLMRHSNVATTMNVYGNSTLRAKQDANSKVVRILINPERDKDVA